MSVIQDETELELSSYALEALKDFALSKGIEIDQNDNYSIRKNIQEAFDWKEKDESFNYEFHVKNEIIQIPLKGLRRDLGQTLESTGLTLWRGADILANFIVDNIGNYYFFFLI